LRCPLGILATLLSSRLCHLLKHGDLLRIDTLLRTELLALLRHRRGTGITTTSRRAGDG